MSSRWTDTAEDLAEAARLKAEKAAKRAAKEERKRREAEAAAAAAAARRTPPPPSKRQKTTNGGDDAIAPEPEKKKYPTLLRFNAATISSCRHVETSFERLNHIEEGSYGIVSRARDLETAEIVALKRLKLERETDGFPITSLREVTTLMAAREHPNVVRLREVVMGDTLKELVSCATCLSPTFVLIWP
jgi:cell division cycle 2-like protein